VGEMSLIDGQPRMADGLTAEPTDLLMLDRDDFLHCLRQCPDAALAVMAVMAARLRQSANDLGRQRRHGLLGKVAAVLLELADSYGKESDLGLRIARPITHEQIAQRVGAARESVSRTLASLKKSGILATQGRQLIILDRKKLEHYARR
jgi:CRP/FNR family transcriptional regulator, cyclic AMP receptor protein